MSISDTLYEKVIDGYVITKEDAMQLAQVELETLCANADRLRKHFMGDDFDMCAVLSIKGGRCSENCRFCSQARDADTSIKQYPLLDEKIILRAAGITDLHKGIRHYCLVSSGRRLSNNDVDKLCETIKTLREKTALTFCGSLGLLDEEASRKLKAAGLSRIHNNLEVSESFFPKVCTSHTFEDKINTLKAAKAAGLELCCGGIIGVGESFEDRIDMALTIREFDAISVPINILNPVKGTPMGDNIPVTDEEVRRTVAVFRFITPHAYIRLAAGRGFLPDTGNGCFKSGCNATITGNMLTVKGITIDSDLEGIERLGFKLEKE